MKRGGLPLFSHYYIFSFSDILIRLLICMTCCILVFKFSRIIKNDGNRLSNKYKYATVLAIMFTMSLVYLENSFQLKISFGSGVNSLLIHFLFSFGASWYVLSFSQTHRHDSKRYILASIVLSACVLGSNYTGFYAVLNEYAAFKPIFILMAVPLTISTSFSLTRFLIQIANEDSNKITYRWAFWGSIMGGISLGSIPFIILASFIDFERMYPSTTEPYAILIPFAFTILANLGLMLFPDFFGERLMKKNSETYKSLFKYNPNSVFWIDLKGNIKEVNDQACILTGYSKKELKMTTFWELLGKNNDKAEMQFYYNQVKEGITSEIEAKLLTKDGEERDIIITAIRTIVNEKIIGVYGIIRDTTDEKSNSKMIHFLAYHDELTKLPNRCLLEKEALRLMKDQIDFSFLYINIDRFRRINDTFGHTYGDEILKQIAELLVENLPKDCTVSRISGDEFSVLSPAWYDAEKVASEIVEIFKSPLLVDHTEFHMSLNIGISTYPTDTKEFEELLKYADLALDTVKSKSNQYYSFYKQGMIEDTLTKVELENDLRRAIEIGEIMVFYQPKYDTYKGEIIGSEALARWNHSTYGFISPTVFIKIAEEAKLIVSLERLVIRQVFEQIKVWKREGIYIQPISINISVIHFSQDDFVEFFVEALKEFGLSGSEIGIEVTETIMMHDKQENNHLLQQLRQMGIQVSIDDFGTGYSSFSYLNQLAVDTLKIDKSFIDDYESNSKIISAIISMSHSLNLKVIAEGVETDKQMAFLKSVRCDEVQGYLYSRPVPAHELRRKLMRVAN